MNSPTSTAVIGFDLGHGQTALAKAYADRTTDPEVIDLPGSVGKQHVTLVAEHPRHGVIIGEAGATPRDVSRLWLAFKSPELNAEPVRRPTQLFISKVVEDLSSHALLPQTGRLEWFAGAPSGWSKEIRDAYAELFREAGVQHINVVPESRAALLYARESGDVQLGPQTTVLIVDIGSSTTDYTSVVGVDAVPVDHGNTRLGSRLIDREILRLMLEKNPQRAGLEAIMLDDPNVRVRLELACRRAKEEYFCTPQERFHDDPNTKITVSRDVEGPDGEDLLFVVRLRKSHMDAVLATPQSTLGGASWIEAFRDDLTAAIGRLDHRPDMVLLTGGPSRMGFVTTVCQEVVGPDTQVLRGSEPEYAIARGLALAGRTSIKTAGFRKDVRRFIKSGQIESLVQERLPALAEALGGVVADGITERHVIPAFIQWRNGEFMTLNDMAAAIATLVNDSLQDPHNTRLLKVFTVWQNELRPDLEELTRPICARWGISKKSLALPVLDLSGSDISISQGFGAATDTVENVAEAANVLVAGVLATILFGAGTAIIATTGPLGVVLGFMAFLYIGSMGKDAAMKKAAASNIPLGMRRMKSEQGMVAKLRQGAVAQEEELARKFAEEFTEVHGEQLASGIARAIVEELEVVASDAELLIR